MLKYIIFFLSFFSYCTQVSAQKNLYSLILAGDAGIPDKQALKVLNKHAELNPGNTAVFMLGDNIYDIGLPDPEHKLYKQSKKRLLQQVNALKDTQAKVVFIPGNHDWDNTGENGLKYLHNQQQLVEQQLGAGSFMPANGCPGPVVALNTDFFRVVVFDSEWWHFEHSKPGSINSGCTAYDRQSIAQEFKKIIDSSDKPLIYLQHHPLISAYYTPDKKDCYFDPECKNLTELKDFLSTVFKEKPAFLCAFGHDHSLQHLGEKYFCRNHIISGAMSNSRKTKDKSLAKFVHEGLGFVRIDFLDNQQFILSIIGVDKDSSSGKVLYKVSL